MAEIREIDNIDLLLDEVTRSEGKAVRSLSRGSEERKEAIRNFKELISQRAEVIKSDCELEMEADKLEFERDRLEFEKVKFYSEMENKDREFEYKDKQLKADSTKLKVEAGLSTAGILASVLVILRTLTKEASSYIGNKESLRLGKSLMDIFVKRRF